MSKPRSLRVGFIEAGSGRGGSTYSLLRVLRALRAESPTAIEPMIFTLYPAAAEIFTTADFPAVCLRSGNFFGRLLEMRSLLKTHALDLIHCNNPLYDHRPFLLAARSRGIPATVHFRCSRLLTRSERWLLGGVAHLFYNSSAGGRVLENEPACPPEKRSFVANGVDLSLFTTSATERLAARAKLNLAENDFAILLPATLQPGKGQLDAVDALAELRGEGLPRQLFFAGEEHYQSPGFKNELLAKITAAGLCEQVHLLGHRDDMPELLAASDLVIQPTRLTEAWTNSLIEAMAAGRPVIGARAGGIPEIVDDKVGILVEPGDPSGLAAAIAAIHKDPSLAKKLGLAARVRAEELFDIRLTARHLHEVFTALVGLDVNGNRHKMDTAHA